jgi:carboxymethylenebutenolidase
MGGSMVTFPTNGSTTSGYLAMPKSGTGPGVLVIQEWWGLVPHIKHVADRLAGEGFVALAPDMYHGKTASEPDGAGKLFMALNIAQAEKDLRGAAAYLLTRSSGKKIGAVGFCMGGQLALFAATLNPTVGACVNFYGIHPNVKPDYAKLAGPVLGLYAERDGFVTPAVARQVDADIRKAGKSSEIHVYPGVDHAFFNDEREDV